MSLFRQEDGRNATVHYMTVGVKPKNFKWVVNDKVIFKSQKPKFEMTKARAGIYICKLTYDDGRVLQSNACKVECRHKDKIQFNLDSVEKILNGMVSVVGTDKSVATLWSAVKYKVT